MTTTASAIRSILNALRPTLPHRWADASVFVGANFDGAQVVAKDGEIIEVGSKALVAATASQDYGSLRVSFSRLFDEHAKCQPPPGNRELWQCAKRDVNLSALVYETSREIGVTPTKSYARIWRKEQSYKIEAWALIKHEGTLEEVFACVPTDLMEEAGEALKPHRS